MAKKPGWLLTRGQRISYSVGMFSTSFITANVMAWILYFYAPPPGAVDGGMVFLGVGVAVGLARLFGSLVDAFTNPIVAFWSDRSTNPKGRRIPFIKRGLLPLVIFAILMWFPPVRGTSHWNVIWLGITLSGTWFFYTYVVAPYLALMPEIATDPEERVSLTVTMSYWEAGAIVLSAVAIPPMIEALKDGVQLGPLFLEDGYKVTAAILAVIGAVGFLISISRIRERPPKKDKMSTFGLRQSVVECFRNPAFPPYLLAVAAAKIGMGIVMISIPFVATAVLHKGEGFVATLFIPLFFSTILGFVVGEAFVNRVGLKRAFRTATGMATGITLAFFAVTFLGGDELPLVEAREDVAAEELVLVFGAPDDPTEVRVPTKDWEALFPAENRRFDEGLVAALPAPVGIADLTGDTVRLPLEVGAYEEPERTVNLQGWSRLLSTPEERAASTKAAGFVLGPTHPMELSARLVWSDGSVSFTDFALSGETPDLGGAAAIRLAAIRSDAAEIGKLMARFDLRIEQAWSTRIWVIIFLFFLLGFPAAILMSMYRPIVCEIVDLDEQRVGTRREAIYFGVEGLLTKGADGVAAVVAPAVMLLGHWLAPPPMGYMVTFSAAGVVMFLGWWVFRYYPLGKTPAIAPADAATLPQPTPGDDDA